MRFVFKIMLKKTRPEKTDKPAVKGYNMNNSPNDVKDSMSGLVMPSNPYQVKAEPGKHLRKEAENPYEVKKEPDNPYEVKKEPANPYAVKKEPETPYTVKKDPDHPYEVKKHPNKPRVSNRFYTLNYVVHFLTKQIAVEDQTLLSH